MKKIKIITEVDGLHDSITEYFYVEDDMLDDEIEIEAKIIAFNSISWSFWEVDEGEEEE